MSDVEMQSHDDSAPAPTTAVVDPDPPGTERIDDEEDTGGVDEEVAGDAGEQKGASDSKEEAGEVIEGSEKTSPVEAAKQEAANDELHVEGEGEVDGDEEVEEEEEKRRPGRPKKKSTNGGVEAEPKSVKRARPRAEKKGLAAAFVADRPTRERKSIDRFTASADKDKAKELQIKQGGGTPLKDIPNVVYKLSKRSRHDETLSQLHSVLFSKRGKAMVLKQNILQFSGYVWVENEAKERVKVQEKLERYTKESLLQFLELLDVHVSRTLKKEELVVKLLEFLEKPHKTTEKLLEVKEQEKKSSGKRSSSAKGPGRPKIRKGDDKTPSKRRARKNAAEDDGSDGSEKASDSESPEEEMEQKRLTFKDETDHEEESMVEEKKQASNSSTAVKQETVENEVEEEEEEEDHEEKEESTPPRKKKTKVEAPDSTLKTPSKSADRFYSKKKANEDAVDKETPSRKGPGRPKKSLGNSAKKTLKDKEPGKKSAVKGSKAKKKGEAPSDEELQAKIRELLKEADFSKVTFTDVVSQLEAIFAVSLTEQKGHVKGLIRDEISKLTEADDEPEEEVAAGEATKEEKPEEDMVTA